MSSYPSPNPQPNDPRQPTKPQPVPANEAPLKEEVPAKDDQE